MVVWRHRLNGREFEQTLGDGEGQDGEVESLILCPPDVKSQLIRKDPDAEKDRAGGQE